jgi:hypothetical protein
VKIKQLGEISWKNFLGGQRKRDVFFIMYQTAVGQQRVIDGHCHTSI